MVRLGRPEGGPRRCGHSHPRGACCGPGPRPTVSIASPAARMNSSTDLSPCKSQASGRGDAPGAGRFVGGRPASGGTPVRGGEPVFGARRLVERSRQPGARRFVKRNRHPGAPESSRLDERAAGEGQSAFAAMPTLPGFNEPIAGGAAIGSFSPWSAPASPPARGLRTPWRPAPRTGARSPPGARASRSEAARSPVSLEQEPEMRFDGIDGEVHLVSDLTVGGGRRRIGELHGPT